MAVSSTQPRNPRHPKQRPSMQTLRLQDIEGTQAQVLDEMQFMSNDHIAGHWASERVEGGSTASPDKGQMLDHPGQCPCGCPTTTMPT